MLTTEYMAMINFRRTYLVKYSALFQFPIPIRNLLQLSMICVPERALPEERYKNQEQTQNRYTLRYTERYVPLAPLEDGEIFEN